MKGYTGGKNVFGLGINMTGALLGVFFFGVYFGSGWLARKTIMSENPDAERAHYLVYKPPGCPPGAVLKPKHAEDEVVAAFKRETARGLPIERYDAHR